MEVKKLFYTMGELSEMFDVTPSLIRHWERNFDVIKPARNKKGNRLFTPDDVENFRLIYHLVKERGMTLEGAQRSLKQNRSSYKRDAYLLERLQKIRALLLEVREELKSEDEFIVNDDEGALSASCDKDGRTILRFDESGDEISLEPEQRREPKERKPRRKVDSQDEELFAFYEQSLF
ncbi:MAG: MerR family transcriptional regulator [Rikenellaceae bacterium]